MCLAIELSKIRQIRVPSLTQSTVQVAAENVEELVNDFVYLGLVISHEGGSEAEILQHIGIARNCFSLLDKNIWKSHYLGPYFGLSSKGLMHIPGVYCWLQKKCAGRLARKMTGTEEQSLKSSVRHISLQVSAFWCIIWAIFLCFAAFTILFIPLFLHSYDVSDNVKFDTEQQKYVNVRLLLIMFQRHFQVFAYCATSFFWFSHMVRLFIFLADLT